MPITDSDLVQRLNDYVTELFAPEDDTLRWIQEEAAKQGCGFQPWRFADTASVPVATLHGQSVQKDGT